MTALATLPYVVSLETWQCPVYGERWTLSYEERTVVTRGTEFEARAMAKAMRWQVTVGTEGEL